MKEREPMKPDSRYGGEQSRNLHKKWSKQRRGVLSINLFKKEGGHCW